MASNSLPNDLQDCHRLIAMLQERGNDKQQTIAQQTKELQDKATELSLKDKLVEEQAHSVLQLKDNQDKLDIKVVELNLTIEKLLKQLYGRKSERRIDSAGL